MPAMFCDAIVTMNSGSAMLTMRGGLEDGGDELQRRQGADADRSPGPSMVTAMIAATMAPGAAHGRDTRVSTAHTSTTGTASHGISTTARTGPTQIGSSTPASIALASAGGIEAIARPSAPHSPLSTMSAPQTRTADRGGEPAAGAPVDTSSAAPGSTRPSPPASESGGS